MSAGFFYGLALGSLIIAAVKKDFAIPRRPYSAALAILIAIGIAIDTVKAMHQ